MVDVGIVATREVKRAIGGERVARKVGGCDGDSDEDDSHEVDDEKEGELNI